MRNLAPFRGTVTFQGKPLTEGVVIFSNPHKGIYMTAKLNAQGHYKVVMARAPDFRRESMKFRSTRPYSMPPWAPASKPARCRNFPIFH